MERNREAKGGGLAAVNGIGLSRRRHRITALRDSSEEEGQMELQVTVRSRERERVHKTDRVRYRDQELITQRKRRRTERLADRSKHRDVEGGSAEHTSGPSGEETYDNEEEYEEPSSSMSRHALRRTVTPTRNIRPTPGSRVADETIGAAVPRRSRSASVRRFNDQWVSRPWGFGERRSRRRISLSPLGGSVDIVSPSTSSVSLTRKMKPLAPKGLISKVSREPLPLVEDDIEIEVVEALFDLMKQSKSQLPSRSSKKDERISNDISGKKLDLIGNKNFRPKSVRSPSVSPQVGAEASDLLPDINSTSIPSLDVELIAENELKFGKISSDALELMGEISLEKGKDSSKAAQESVGADHVVVAREEESSSCSKSVSDGSADSTMSKANLASEVVKPKREADLEIDLMALPPMPSSPIRDGLNIMPLDLKFDSEKPEQENDSNCSYNTSQQRGSKEQDHCIPADLKRNNFGQSSSLTSPVAASGWPGAFPHPGYMAPLETLLHMDGSSRTTALPLAPFSLSQPRSKRCATHQLIACNIRHHQQLTKNYLRPAAIGPATLHEADPCSRDPTTPLSNSLLGKPLQGDSSGRHALATPPVSSLEGKSSEVAKNVDATKGKQHMPQQKTEQAPGGNLLQTALIFPLGQQQATNMPGPGSDKSARVLDKASLSNNSTVEPALGSFSFPAGAAAVSFNISNIPTNDGPRFMGVLPNNVHPHPTSTNSGMALPHKGAQARVLPFLNASYYPSILCISQNQQKRSTCQPQSYPLYHVQQTSPTNGTSSSSTSSRKQSKSQQQIVGQTSNHSSFSSEGLQPQESHKQQHVMGLHLSNSVDRPGSHAQKPSNGQNYGIPFQTMNFALVPRGDGNQLQPGSEPRVAVIPPEAIGFSFDSTASTNLSFNFSALPQDPAIVQMLSDVGHMRHQFVPSAQVAQHKNFHVAEKKSLANSTDTERKKDLLAKSVDRSLDLSKLDSSNPSNSAVKGVAIDGSAQTQSSLPPLNAGSQYFSYSSTTPIVAFSVNAPISQQPKEMIQLEKQRTQQMQTGTDQVQGPISNNFRYAYIGCNYPNNNPIFSFVHNDNFVQSSQWKNASITTSQVLPSLATTTSLKNLPQQQSRNSQGQPHISFGSSSNSATSSQGQQLIRNSQPTSSKVDWHSSKSSASVYICGSGSWKTTLGGSKARVAATELSSGPNQKSIPVCGRDVPSILNTCTSQLSELKY